MPQSKDIVILDPITINDSNVNFDEIISKSDRMVSENATSKKKQVSKNDINISKKDQKIMNMIQQESEMNEKQNLIYIIQKYQSSSRFGNYVRTELKINYTEEQLNKKTLSQLEIILHKIRLHLDNQNLSKMYDGMLYSSTLLIEKMSKPVANVDGFSKLLFENEEFLNSFERVKCESVMPTIPSHLQLLLILGQTYFMAYAINKVEEPKEQHAEVQAVIDEVDKQITNELIITDENNKEKNNDEKENKDKTIIQAPKIENGMGI